MRILVSGAGRSGTNLVTEVARGLGVVKFTKQIEDRRLFDYDRLPENYGTKLATDHPAFSLDNIRKAMNNYPDLHIIFSIRHPVDTCMSKIVRGHIGGTSPDRTVEGSIAAFQHFYIIYVAMHLEFEDRIFGIKMESLLLDPQKEVDAVATFLGIKATAKALEFFKYNRNRYHGERYGGRIDLTQIDVHKRWEEAYDGFFNQRKKDVEILKMELKPIMKKLGYNGEDS